jgi:putative addiction module component (TIGR02574 family)
MSRDSVLQHALALSPDDRVQLIDDLLDSVIAPDECSELTPEQQAELLRRLEADRADPDAAIPWDEAEKQITSLR